MTATDSHPSTLNDALIIGGGPAGAATALALATAGHAVTVIDHHDRAADGSTVQLLTPRAVAELDRLGIDLPDAHHSVSHIRITHPGGDAVPTSSSSFACPPDPNAPDRAAVGATLPVGQVAEQLLTAAAGAGATVMRDVTATGAIVERGFVRGATVDAGGRSIDVRSRFTVIADGANSRFGRQLGTVRQPTWPFAVVRRAGYACTMSEVAEIDIVVGLRDTADTALTGHAWMLPAGDGTATVTLAILSTSPSFRVINPERLLESVVADHADRWRISPEPLGPITGGRLPLGLSVGPVAGPNYLLVGDAAGAANPFTALGLEPALTTARLAAQVIDEAIESNAAAALQRYPQLLDEHFGEYYQIGRLSARVFSHPSVSERIARLLSRRERAAQAAARLAIGHFGGDGSALADLTYRAAQTATLIAPNA